MKAATMTLSRDDTGGFSSQRVVRLAALLVAAGAVAELVLARSVAGAASLTLAGVVAIINFRWLEVVLGRVIHAGEPRYDRSSVIRIVGRLGLLGGVFAALVLVPQIDPVAIALGFSALVVALVFEGVRGARVGGG